MIPFFRLGIYLITGRIWVIKKDRRDHLQFVIVQNLELNCELVMNIPIAKRKSK